MFLFVAALAVLIPASLVLLAGVGLLLVAGFAACHLVGEQVRIVLRSRGQATSGRWAVPRLAWLSSAARGG